MTRARINLVIDAAMALVMAAIAGIGFLMHWILIPGEARPAVYGGRPDLYWLGLDRHEWGDIHLVLGIALLALVVLHVALHWGQVVAIWRGMVPNRAARLAAALVLLVLILVLMAFPAFVAPEVVEVRRGEGQGRRAVERSETGMRDGEIGRDDTTAERPDGLGRGRGGEGRGLGGGGGGERGRP